MHQHMAAQTMMLRLLQLTQSCRLLAMVLRVGTVSMCVKDAGATNARTSNAQRACCDQLRCAT